MLALLAVSACSAGLADRNNDLAPVCAEQSDWATQGRMDGVDITITCP
jgi:hypothetical protein